MSADSDAFKAVQAIPGLTPKEQQYLLAVSRGEGFYGLGWGNPSTLTISESAKYGIDPRAGVGSNNWGAEQGVGNAGSFPHVDFGWMIPALGDEGKPVLDGKGQLIPTQNHWKGKGPRIWGSYVGEYKRHKTPTDGAASIAKTLLKPNLKEALKTGIYKGQQIGPMRAAVFSQHDNGYFELDPEKYLSAVKRNYDILTKNLGWPALLLTSETIAADPLVQAGSGSQSSEQSEPCSGSSHLPEAGFLRGQKYSVPGVQDEPEKK